MSELREGLRQERGFFGGMTRRVHVSHDWGALFCKDCGLWPDEAGSLIACKGPSWRTVILRQGLECPMCGGEGRIYNITEAIEQAQAAGTIAVVSRKPIS